MPLSDGTADSPLELQLQLVAEFEGSGLLTCIVQHDGAVYVGCEEGEAALYTVGFDTGFEAVADFPDAGANVQSMVSAGGRLWCFGWRPLKPRPANINEKWNSDAVVWCWDGSTWSTITVRPNWWGGVLRWCLPVVTADGGIACSLWKHGEQSALSFAGTVRDGRFDAGGPIARAQVMLGDRLVRMAWMEDFAWIIEGSTNLLTYWRNGTQPALYGGVSCGSWGYPWNALRPMVSWLGRVWLTQMVNGVREKPFSHQRLISTAGGDNPEYRVGPMWSMTSLGLYDLLIVWRGRLLLCGDNGAGEPVYGLWDPPRMVLGRPLPWRVRDAVVAADGTLWALGTQGWKISPDYPGSPTEIMPGVYRPDMGSWRQAVLMTPLDVALANLTVEWGDGLGANRPALDDLRVEWARTWPRSVQLADLTVEWGDGLGTYRPALADLTVIWGDGHAQQQPTLADLEVSWSKGGDRRPALAALTAEWGDGLGAAQPTVADLTAHWSVGYTAARPAVADLTADWSDRPPGPPPAGVRVDLLRVEWAHGDYDPTGDGSEVLWLMYTAPPDVVGDVVGLRVVTSLDVPEGEELECLVRCDAEAYPVEAWPTYQRFRSNRRVTLDRPGRVLRVGIIKPAAFPEDTDVFVQFRFDN